MANTNKMGIKANQVAVEELLRGIPKEQWGLGWEAIEDATKKDIVFKTQGAIFAYINTYIWRKDFNDTYYQRRTKANGNEYIMKSLPVTAAMEKYGIAEYNDAGESNYQDMIGGAFFDGTINDDLTDNVSLMEYRVDLSRLGIPDYFIDIIMDGGKIFVTKLTKEEREYLEIAREAFAYLKEVV